MYASSSVIYADILFLINFSLDFLCLFITGRVLNCGGRTLRLVSGALIGGLYSFIPYVLEATPYISIPLHIAAAALICFIAFGRKDLKKFFVIVGTFIVSSALLGGLISAVYGISSQYSDGTYTEIDAVSFCLICVFSAAVALSYGLICRRKIHIRTAEIRIHLESDKVDMRLLVDSGNLVTEPFSALPVIVVTASALPPPYDMPESDMFPMPLRAIPFRTGAGSSCFLGFRPKKIEIIRLIGKPIAIDAYVGIDTQNKSYSGYDGLMPSSLL